MHRARDLRKYSTRAERIVWRWLRDRRFGGWKSRRQYPIGRYIADFYCDPLKLVIELDGSGHALKVAYDEERTRYLAALGIYVVRLLNMKVLSEPNAAADTIIAAILLRRPPTRRFAAPSPQGEG
ncbi:MAG TPA: endonuclease domain-containing protein [Thermoanaerobaculia bacterium]